MKGIITIEAGKQVYPDPSLRVRMKEKFSEAIEWPPPGLPEDYYPLLAPCRLVLAGNSREQVQAALQDILQDKLSVCHENFIPTSRFSKRSLV